MPTCGNPNCKTCNNNDPCPCPCPGCNKTPKEECYSKIQEQSLKFLMELSKRDFVCFMLAMEDARSFRSRIDKSIRMVDEMILQKTMKDMFKLFTQLQQHPDTAERFNQLVEKLNTNKIPTVKA